jgi:hypothetical protein
MAEAMTESHYCLVEKRGGCRNRRLRAATERLRAESFCQVEFVSVLKHTGRAVWISLAGHVSSTPPGETRTLEEAASGTGRLVEGQCITKSEIGGGTGSNIPAIVGEHMRSYASYA